jgi:conjugative transfer region protein (TIGR03750 family)
MILTHINHKMPIYKDCTLFELLAVSISVLGVGGCSLSLLTRLLFGYGSIGMALILLSFVHISRFFLARLQKLKFGKPHGYYLHLFLKHLASCSFIHYFWQSPWLMREGRWSVRAIRRHHA